MSNSDSYTGFIIKVSDTHFIMHLIGKNGEDEGTSVFKVEDVSSFQINDMDNRRRAMLYIWRKARY
jgi:hypothetical protein